jgi:hypothetical protein
MEYNSNMDPKSTNQPVEVEASDKSNRRELVAKLGKFAAYAAPFTVMAFTNKAEAGFSGGKQARPSSPQR